MKEIIKCGCYALLAVIGGVSYFALLPLMFIQGFYYALIWIFTRKNNFYKNPINSVVSEWFFNYR